MPMLLVIGSAVAQTAPQRPTYKEVQRAWGLLAGHAGLLVLWSEECASGNAAWREKLKAPFREWKERNKYMDDLRANVYARAQLEGGEAEAKRFSKEVSSEIVAQLESVRGEVRTRKGAWDCSRLIAILNDKQLDPANHYQQEVGLVRRAAD